MKNQEKEDLGIMGWVVVIILLVFAIIGCNFVVNQILTLKEPVLSITKQQNDIKVYAKDYTHIQFFDGTRSYSSVDTAVDVLKVKKVNEVTRENGEVVSQYEYEGVEFEAGKKLRIKGTTWLTLEEFSKVFLPLGGETKEVAMLCKDSWNGTNLVEGKLLVTIESSIQKDNYIIEDSNGEVQFIDHSEECEFVTKN